MTPAPGRGRLEKARATPAGQSASAVTPRTRAILVNSPDNPTGRMLTAAEAYAVARVADRYDVLPDVSGLGFGSAQECAAWLIDRTGVVVTPGSAFGPTVEQHVRLSFAASTEILTTAVERLEAALRQRATGPAVS
ncbi:aminotransferase class I/II-fold pyridoxal phosphate-dependent enzyme [Streptomyces sp. NPDC091406]|uniref:aminotransferase class I/II-fold pyridoxal phosphate-dependent enzyme n=1 Tax=unclassified Streptomyces TaxID=2593676 RepID=UPI003823FA04